jgi:hypothetical protein
LNAALGPAAEGIEQQAAITALHHRVAEARQPYGAVAKIMSLPAALGNAAGSKKNLGDVPVARVVGSAIERPQREHEAIASGGGQRGRVALGRAAGQAAPKSKRG